METCSRSAVARPRDAASTSPHDRAHASAQEACSKLDARAANRSVEEVSRFRLLSAVPVALVALACSSQAALVAKGGACELATDCQNGLICEPVPVTAKTCPCQCTGNLQGVQQLPPMPDAGMALPAGDASADDDVLGMIPTSLDAASAGD